MRCHRSLAVVHYSGVRVPSPASELPIRTDGRHQSGVYRTPMPRALMLDMPQVTRHSSHLMNKSLYVNGVPELLVLRLLTKEEMYGYQLVAEINARSKDALDFGEGCIYPILHRLVAQKHLSSRREIVEGRPRHYYRATAKGKRHVEQLQSEWSRVVAGTSAVLGTSHVLV